MDKKDIQFGEKDYQLSLKKLTGLAIKDIICSVSYNFGFPVVQIDKVVFENDVQVEVGGEHDIAFFYIDEDKVPNLDSETLKQIEPIED